MAHFFCCKEFYDFCQDVFGKLPIPIDVLDKDGRLIYINDAFADFLEKSKEEMLGKVVSDVDSNTRFIETLRGKQAEIAWKHKFRNGKEAIVHRIPILDDDGKVTGGFGMVLFEDISKLQEVMDKCNVLDRELRMYKNTIAKLNCAKYNLSSIIGISKTITDCKNKVKKIAKVNLNVLITGESGVGKELFAHSIHNASNRRDEPFVSINCSAIPENLIEAELFGYEDGAFTGAKKGGNIGKFQLANGGTIFLDEIGEMPMHMQAKLLRVLQEREVQPIGSRTQVKLNVRVICATHKNIEEMVEKGEFREDLYYRLNVLTLEVPGLRERKDDIPKLVEKFLANFYKQTGIYRCIPQSVINIFYNYDWHGNVRELKNIVEKACVNAEEVNVSINDLPPYMIKKSTLNVNIANKTSNASGLKEILDSVEKEIIMNTLKECNHNKSEVAKKLSITRTSLYRKIEEYGL
ncbi:sigma-54 interaction domain-containing protein [Clostridium ganghwense]|uniref:Sigma 54-interacting transcriptional regulator n=1 Tax=Clostridium ganghwense TaxID=312089 RepID=A0ABT4CSU4_9CLOT|nr:sigma 54-interacting transcriptional regulator [Clostridium ganghwense]MCY6372145.1 sigma 54-interacting transcriptional regulator [Clostridium ganghwense]